MAGARPGLSILLASIFATCVLVVPSVHAEERVALYQLDTNLQADIEAPLREKLAQLANSKNEAGVENKRGSYSRLATKVDDSTYRISMVVKTAGEDTLTTQQWMLTVSQDPDKERKWTITDEQVVRTFDELHREVGYYCYPFDSFSFARYGLTLSGGKGNVCETYYGQDVSSFVVVAANMRYDYEPPHYLDYYQTYPFLKSDYASELIFPPKGFEFECDPGTCDELLNDGFTGLKRREPSQRTDEVHLPADIDPTLREYIQKKVKERDAERKDDPFAHFRRAYTPDRRRLVASVAKNLDEGVTLTYDNWAGFEVVFSVAIQWPSVGRFVADLYGYYTDETMAASSPYDLERRDDLVARFYDLTSVVGTVEAGLEDPEILRGDVRFGVHIKQPTKVLEFAIATLPRENVKRPALFINSVEYQGQDLLWVQTSPFSGMIVFPEELQAGEDIDLRIVFASRAIEKVNHAFSRTPRGSWLPLVTFGDFIDKFELTLVVQDKYTPLGVGTKVSEERKDGHLITKWVAENPVEFPSIIFGKYNTDHTSHEPKKLDGTPIPVNVYVDEVSMGHVGDVASQQDLQEFSDAFSSGARGIRGKQLRPLADQAAYAIELYTELSGIDYPYGELNLVNDPSPALYGQAPSSLIYLGSLVFRGEGTMASDGMYGGGRSGGTSTAKFLKSVVAHEVGHQWWGSRVANANSRNYWFVESLAEFFSALYLERVYGPAEYQEKVDEWRRTILDRDVRSSVQNASTLWPGEDFFADYQAAVYNKGPYAFHMLREIFGDEKFFPALKQFCQILQAKGEIVTRDIQLAAEQAFGGVNPDGSPYNVDLSWFFDQWIRGTGLPQYAFTYELRQTEDGKYVLDGKIKQRVVIGSKSKFHVLDNTYYRGIVPVTVKGKKNEFSTKVVVEGPETVVHLKVPEKPVEVLLNDHGVTLAQDAILGWDFK